MEASHNLKSTIILNDFKSFIYEQDIKCIPVHDKMFLL